MTQNPYLEDRTDTELLRLIKRQCEATHPVSIDCDRFHLISQIADILLRRLGMPDFLGKNWAIEKIKEAIKKRRTKEWK